MEQLKNILRELIGINDEEWLLFKKGLSENEYAPKTTIIMAGDVARHIFFIKSGLLRTFHLQSGKEVNTYFACDKQFISTFSSFITQTPSFEFLETVEHSTVLTLSYDQLSRLYETNGKFEKLGRILAEKNYLCVLDRTISMQTKTAKEKYLDFIKEYDKKIVTRMPQHHIASFLGMTPESLSRIRKQISIS